MNHPVKPESKTYFQTIHPDPRTTPASTIHTIDFVTLGPHRSFTQTNPRGSVSTLLHLLLDKLQALQLRLLVIVAMVVIGPRDCSDWAIASFSRSTSHFLRS